MTCSKTLCLWLTIGVAPDSFTSTVYLVCVRLCVCLLLFLKGFKLYSSFLRLLCLFTANVSSLFGLQSVSVWVKCSSVEVIMRRGLPLALRASQSCWRYGLGTCSWSQSAWKCRFWPGDLPPLTLLRLYHQSSYTIKLGKKCCSISVIGSENEMFEVILFVWKPLITLIAAN